MFFDLSVRGHHPTYIQYLIEYWDKYDVPCQLDIVVSQKFVLEHSDIIDISLKLKRRGLKVISITQDEDSSLHPWTSRLKRVLRIQQEWNLLIKYSKFLHSTSCLTLYFDTYRFFMASKIRLPCLFSGIYFRPSFHYHKLSDKLSSCDSRYMQRLESIVMSQVFSNPNLKTLFCLDALAIPYLNQLHSNANAVYLPDPVRVPNNLHFLQHHVTERIGIEPGRVAFLLFGSITERKGIYQLFEAVQSIPGTICKQICLLLIGESKIAEQIEVCIQNMCSSKPIQVIRRYEYIPESEIPLYFCAANVVLALYQQHIGTSGILLLAASLQKPVISSSYGLMGYLVRQFKLGLDIDSCQPSMIADAMIQFLFNPLDTFCDPETMKSFVQLHSPEMFAKTIFNYT
jgi:glycosyltransferase involved in cell wall biosynthesis